MKEGFITAEYAALSSVLREKYTLNSKWWMLNKFPKFPNIVLKWNYREFNSWVCQESTENPEE